MKSLQWQIFPAPAMPQVEVRPKLLRPVTRHAPANRKYPESILLKQRLGVVLQIFKRVVAKRRNIVFPPRAIMQREVESDLRIAERRYEHRHAFFVRRLENSAFRHVLAQILSDVTI